MDDINPHPIVKTHTQAIYQDSLCLGRLWTSMSQSDQTKVRAPSRQSSPQTIMTWISSLLSHSPTLNALMKEIDQKGWSVVLSKGTAESYRIDVEENVLILPSLMKKSHSRYNLLLNTIRALRDVWYEDHHFDLYETLVPEDWLKWEKIRSADIESFTVCVTWELRVAGQRDLWRTLMGSENGDMAMVFQEIDENQGEHNSHMDALLHTFRQWFMAKDRINETDSTTLAALDEILLTQNLGTPFGKGRLKAQDVQNHLPYLKDVDHMLTNPDFCTIPDDINQAHFFHIMNDLETVQIDGVRFRDKALAAKIFPQG